MKNLLTYFGIILLCLAGNQVHSQSKKLTVPLSFSGERAHINIDVFSGTVHVRGTSRRDVLIRYELLENEKKEWEEAGNGLKKISGAGINLDVREKNNKVKIDSDHSSKAIRVMVEIPYRSDLTIGTHHHGDIEVAEISGEIELKTHHGGIEATGIKGSVIANTWHKDIVVEFDELDPDAPLAFTTYHGKVDISLPSNAKIDLKATSAQGEILTGFDISLRKEDNIIRKTKKDGTYKVSLTDWVQGSINGGGQELMVKTHHGDVFIRNTDRRSRNSEY